MSHYKIKLDTHFSPKIEAPKIDDFFDHSNFLEHGNKNNKKNIYINQMTISNGQSKSQHVSLKLIKEYISNNKYILY